MKKNIIVIIFNLGVFSTIYSQYISLTSNPNSTQNNWYYDVNPRVNPQNNTLLDNLKESEFTPFDKFLQKPPGSNQPIENFEYEEWGGELHLIGSLLFNPRNLINGYKVYDLNKMKYGRIVYITDCSYSEGHQGIIDDDLYNNNYYSFCENKIFKTKLDDKDYSEYQFYQTPYQNGYTKYGVSATKILELPERGSEFEFEKDGRIYTYKYLENQSATRPPQYNLSINKSNESILTCSKVIATQNNCNYAYLANYNYGSLSSSKIININKIIETYYLSQNKVERKPNYSWNIDEVNYLSNGNVLLTVDIKESFAFYFPKEFKYGLFDKYKLAVLLNNNFDFIKSKEIVSSDKTLYCNNGNIVEVISDSAKVVCYDSNLKLLWKNKFGTEKGKLTGKVTFSKEVNNKLYLMGVANNKYHIGKNDPIIWKLDGTTGKLINEEVIKLQSSPSSVEGFLLSHNNLFLVINSSKAPLSNILKKVNLIID